MLKLKASAKINKRYILIEGKENDVEKAILDYIGILGWVKSSPVWVKNKNKRNNNYNILAVNRKEINKIRAGFSISNDKIRILGVSGTLYGLKKFAKA